MTTLTVNIIGAGKLGTTMGRILRQSQHANILGICNQHFASAQSAVRLIGAGTAYATLNELPAAQLYLICTPDDVIASVAKALHATGTLPQDAVIVHTSGVHSSDILRATDSSKHAVASLHPIRSFSDANVNLSTLDDTYCAMEGDRLACEMLRALFKTMGVQMFNIDKQYKAIYHAASVMANNYLVTLHAHATHCFTHAGLDVHLSAVLVSQLMQGALHHVDDVSHRRALTGPIQRGDVNTVNAHVQALTQHDALKESEQLYRTLGLGTLALTTHDTNAISRFVQVLQDR